MHRVSPLKRGWNSLTSTLITNSTVSWRPFKGVQGMLRHKIFKISVTRAMNANIQDSNEAIRTESDVLKEMNINRGFMNKANR